MLEIYVRNLPSLSPSSRSGAPMWRLTIGIALALGLGLAVRADEYGEDINSATDAVGAL